MLAAGIAWAGLATATAQAAPAACGDYHWIGAAGSGQALTINGNVYVLMYSAHDMVVNLDRGNAVTIGSFAALARSLDFTGIATADLPAARQATHLRW